MMAAPGNLYKPAMFQKQNQSESKFQLSCSPEELGSVVVKKEEIICE